MTRQAAAPRRVQRNAREVDPEMSVTLPEVSRAPLTIPTEDEITFRDAVREFAESRSKRRDY